MHGTRAQALVVKIAAHLGLPKCASCMRAICPTRAAELQCAVNAGDFTKQRYLASMEGAVFSGKLAAQAIAQARHPPCNSRHLLSQTHIAK